MSIDPGGYVTDREYLESYQSGIAPVDFHCLSVLRRRRPPEIDRPFRYLDLGCGSGFTCTLLAAAYPEGDFVGVDISPDHVVRARDRAAEIGLPNLRFIEAGFEELLQSRYEELGEFDFVVSHGVLSWISPENREAMARLLGRHVATGGIVYLGYNAMPGWAHVAPIRHLVKRLSEGKSGDPADQAIDEAREFLGLLRKAEAGYLRGNGAASRWLDSLEDKPRSYLAHEYLPRHAEALWHDDIARQLEASRLGYLGSARLVENFDALNVPEVLLKTLREADRNGVGETYRDLAVNQSFRMDVFSRGSPPLDPSRSEEAFDNLLVVAPRPVEIPIRLSTARGEVPLAEDVGNVFAPILAGDPAFVKELVGRAEAGGLDRRHARQAMTAMLAGKIVEPARAREPSLEAVEACKAFNAVARKSLESGRMPWPALASARMGAGMRLKKSEQVALFDRETTDKQLPGNFLVDL